MAITERVEKIRQNYVNTKPHISYERAWSWTKSFQRTEGQPHLIRTARAFYDTCCELPVNICRRDERRVQEVCYPDPGIRMALDQ